MEDAISYHSDASSKIDDVIDQLNRSHKSETDEFNTIKSLRVLQSQINSRIAQLRLIDEKGKRSNNNGKSDNQNKGIISQRDSIIIQKINKDLIDTLSIDALHDSTLTKVPLINNDQINTLEHKIQILNFKEKSLKKLLTQDEIVTKCKYLSQLNSCYYNEIHVNHEFIKRVVSLIKATGIEKSADSIEESERTK